MPVEAANLEVNIKSDGSGSVEMTVHDERLEERVQLLRTSGATRHDNAWHLAIDDPGEIAHLSSHVLSLIADMLSPAGVPDHSRSKVVDRDGNRCRLCSRRFDGPTTEQNDGRQVLDHIYPKHQAGPEHGVHEPYNLAIVCGGCDDVFLQGDAFRFVPSRIEYVFGPLDRQLLAWMQKRALARSDWLLHRITESSDRAVDHAVIVDRLQTFTELGVLRHLPMIGSKQSFEVFAVDVHQSAIVFEDKPSVHRHEKLDVAIKEDSLKAYETTISMDDRFTPPSPRFTPVSEVAQAGDDVT